MPSDAPATRSPVLGPIEQVWHNVFGVLMALTSTGWVGVATAGKCANGR